MNDQQPSQKKINRMTGHKNGPRYNPTDPKHAQVVTVRLPKNVRVLDDGTIVRTLRG